MSSATGGRAAARRSGEPLTIDAGLLAGGGVMGARMRALDWTKTPLGAPERWPQSLKTIVRMMLDSRYAMWMLWGPELTFFCNDAYLPTLGIKRDWALGARSDKVWEEIWPDIGPRVRQVLEYGRSTWDEALQLFLERSGFREETYHTFSYSPVYDDESHIAGMLCVVTEVTERVVGERRLRILRDLAARAFGVTSVEETCRGACEVLEQHPLSMPFGAIYLLDHESRNARRMACTRGPAEHILPSTLDASIGAWPFEALLAGETTQHIADLPAAGIEIPAGPWPDPVRHAFLLPLKGAGSERLVGCLAAGASPRRVLDEAYRTFFGLVAGQVAAAVLDAQASEAERRRAEALAEIDRAKTTFFSNISHEFRTPLTLMIGPVEEAAADAATPTRVREQLDLAHRNSLRLLKLVNSLLDFSRIEAGRVQASFEASDLAVLTADLASTFRSAVERAGLTFTVECAELGEPVYVDREMWEKIVLNLLSNAFKFTLHGSIGVRLYRETDRAVLDICDTGVGIPAQELPRIFDLFHRVEGAVGRTQEGSGIGLALVHELVKLHGGAISARSEVDVGTTFRVSLPLGVEHLPRERIKAPRAPTSTAVGAQAFVDEALRWIPSGRDGASTGLHALAESPVPPVDRRFIQTTGSRLLLADDNSDMRSYLQNLLSPMYTVEVVGDGKEALEAARRERPDLILSDIMMPRLDGLSLLRRLRADESLRAVPVILLSARAGEEARVEGLDAGADDCLVKPFSARELLARVGALLELTQMRRDHEERLRVALASIQDQFYMLDRQWRYILVNPRVTEITGRAAAELLGHSLFELFPDLQGTRFEAELRAAVENREPRRFEHEYAPSNRCFDNAVYPTPHGVAVLVTEVTERNRTEQALREREEQLRLATEAAEIGLWDVDLVNDKLFWPPRVKAMFGISADVAVSMADFYAGLHPLDRQRTSEAFAAALDPERRSLCDVEYRTVGREDGVIRWVAAKGRGVFDASGKCVRVIGTAIDITTRKRAEERLREETRVQELLGKVSHALVAAQLDIERVVQVVTDAATELSGAAFGAFFHKVTGGQGESFLVYTLSGAPREAFARFPHPRNTPVFGPTFRGEAVVRCADITTDPRYGRNPPYRGMPEGHLPVRSYLAVPVKTASGEVLGGLFFGHPQPGVFDERAERLVLSIAAQAAVAFDNARLHQGAQREIEQRKQAEEALRRTHIELKSGMAELARFAQAATGREKRVIELKEEVNSLRERIGEGAKYSLAFDEEPSAPAAPCEPESEGLVPLEMILRTEQLTVRPSRPPDYAAEARALTSLMQALADSPRSILQTLADTVLETLHAGSAGLSLLTEDGRRFYWAGIAGQWSPHRGGGTPREFGPCGDVLARNVPLLFTHWERRYPYLAAATPLAEEGLLVPFHVEGTAVGTIWVISHDSERRFDSEDLRLLESLAIFAALAHRAVKFVGALDQRRAALNLLEDAVEARQQAEESNRKLRQSEEALDEANRRKDEFLAMLAHELRNPLAPIGNASELLSRTIAGDDRAQIAVGMIKRQVTQLTRLVDDLLDVSRITRGQIQLKKRPVELGALIMQAVEPVEPLLREKHHRLSVLASSYEPLYVMGDFARLVQCVGNILTNAIKYTEPGGQISVRTGAEEGTVYIEISDTGMGIPMELLPRVFDLFVQSERTLDRSQGGLGIGLAVVKRLVQMHDGEVCARSEGSGRGSTFEIRLPRTARPTAAVSDPLPFKADPRRVLIVDDNADAANSLSMLLTFQGHQTRVAYGAREALTVIEDFDPEVALLDIGLPEMDGYQLAKCLREMSRLNGLRLIALTGYGQADDQQRASTSGFDAHLVKPVELSALERALGGGT